MTSLIKLAGIVSFFVYKFLTIMHQNIAGLMNKSDLLAINIDELTTGGNSIDIICITEHFMMSGHEELLSFPNYKLAAWYSRESSKRGGACILVKNGHEFKVLPNIAKHSVSGNVECCGIELPLHKISIVCVYRIPKLANLDIFNSKLENILAGLCNRNDKKVILCGDFNIDTLKSNISSTEFVDLLLQYNLKLVIKQATRLVSGTCIDNFAHNIKGGTCRIVDLALSDHTAQILKIPVRKTSKLNYWRTEKRDCCPENLTKIKNYLNSLAFADIYNTNSPNEAFNNFIELFRLLYTLCFPFKIITIKTNKKKNGFHAE